MKKQGKIFIAGGTGMVGSAIIRALQSKGYPNLIANYHSRHPQDDSVHWLQLDLTNQSAVQSFFSTHQPDYVVLAAAKVGGIMANNTYRADFIYQNLMMEANVIHAAYEHGVEKLLFLGSSCIYPKMAEQPLREEALLTGPLEPTNEPYALAKIAGIRMCDAYNRQYGTNFISAMPTNLYGPGDNFNLETSHVLPALIRKFHLAKLAAAGDVREIERDEARFGPIPEGILRDLGVVRESCTTETQRTQSVKGKNNSSQRPLRLCGESPLVRLWGSGKPLREFLHVDDLAAACTFLLEKVDYEDIAFTDASGTVQAHVNVGSGEEVSIRDLAELVQQTVGFQGQVVWDSDKPDGTPRKLMTSGRLRQQGWQPQIVLQTGITAAYREYCSSSHTL